MRLCVFYIQVKLLLDWEQTYINYRSLELPATVRPGHVRAQEGSSQFWRLFVDTVFTLKDDLYDISTIKTLLYPEEVNECTSMMGGGGGWGGGGGGGGGLGALHTYKIIIITCETSTEHELWLRDA